MSAIPSLLGSGTFAFALRALATLAMVAAFALGGWLLYRMARSDRLAVD